MFEFRITAFEDILDPDLSSLVLARFKASNSTSKQTESGRFSDIDSIATEVISGITGHKQIELHDVAVSSGITSIELMSELARIDRDIKMSISDKYSRYSYGGKFLQRVYDASGSMVKCYVLGFIVADPLLRSQFILSKLLFRLVSKIPPPKSSNELLLYHPEILRSSDSGEISIIEYDIFENDVKDRFDYVRCMNILNLNYFSPDQIVDGITNILDSIVDGGFMQIGRTVDRVNHVTIYRKTGTTTLEPVKVIGDGTEIDGLIRSLST